jgi:DeoR family transcriptional regulator of aga operon
MNPRQNTIAEQLAQHGEVSVKDLAEQLGVTPMTIRRDLDQLEGSGLLMRTHGGAVLAKAGIIEFSFKRKGEKNTAEKQAIAREVSRLIHPGMTVTLDTGTTALEVARCIAGTQDLTILTSSLAIASTLYARDNIDLVLLGGKARKGSPDLTGWLTEENLKHFRVDLAVLGADGADRDGAYTNDESVARVSQAVIACAATAVLAVDHTKFERPSFLRYAAWRDLDYVVTDANISSDNSKWLRRAVSHVIMARM